MKPYKRCVLGGRFNILHYGHIELLKKAKDLCEVLDVVLASNTTNKKIYGLKATPLNQRIELLKAIKYVDNIIPGKDKKDYLWVFDKYKYDALILGCDQTLPKEVLEKISKKGIKIIKIPCTQKNKYSSKRYLYDI